MNRYDWMKILTKGYRPPKSNKDKVNSSLVENSSEKDKEKTICNSDLNGTLDTVAEVEPEKCSSKKPKSKQTLAQIKLEEVNHFRNQHNINVNGTDIPPPIRSFEQLMTDFSASQVLYQNLLKEKYEHPTPIQMQAWPLLLNRREILACAPTGSGKTAAFLLPVIHCLKSARRKGFRALIVAPTRELAKQIVRECDRLTEGMDLRASVISKVKSSRITSFFKRIDILVATPNRLIFLMKEDAVLKQILLNVEWLIVDESDKLFEDGKNGFRDQLAEIFRACAGPHVLRAMFSATLSFDVEQWCRLNLNDVTTVSIGTRNAVPDVDQTLSFCGGNAGKLMELHDILRKGYEIPCLIFVQTKERAKKLCEEILLTNRPVRTIHSELSQHKRDEIVKEFREKRVWILICTELMSRGIDFKGVNLVINYDFPPSIVSYVHRVGRTGRAGRKGRAITFWSMEDKPLLRSVAQVMKDSGSNVPDWILSMKTSSTIERRLYAKNLPDRGHILEVKDNRRGLSHKKLRARQNASDSASSKKNKKNRNNEASDSKEQIDESEIENRRNYKPQKKIRKQSQTALAETKKSPKVRKRKKTKNK